jgi:alpha-galactosidase
MSTSHSSSTAVDTALGPAEIAFPRLGNRPGARCVSSTAVLEEALEHGRWIGLYWSATGHVHRENVVTGLPGLDSLKRPLHAFELEIDGQSLHNRWDWAGAAQRAGNRQGTVESVVELRHQVRPVTAKVVTRLDGSPILARYLEITNTGQAPAALAQVAPWAGLLWSTNTERPFHHSYANPSFDERTKAKFTLGYFASEDWGHEGDFVWQPLPQEVFRIERRASGRSWGPPYYILRNEATGELFFMGLGWSGNFAAEFAHRHESQLYFRIGPLGPAPLRLIDPGETVRSPEVHLGPLHCGLDEAVAQWHRHVRTSVLPRRPTGKEIYTMAARVVEEPGDWILREIDIAAQMGVEAFMVDAGWYGDHFAGWWEQRGDWAEGSWLPGGMAGIRARVKDQGMLFGLWHEAEAMARKSRLFAEHPDWMLRTDGDRECAETLNLANPEAARFFTEAVLRIAKEYALDFYKLDYNVAVGEGGQSLRSGYAESEFWRHCEVLYRTYDRLLDECPELCLEDCAGGGGRSDLGMLSRFHYACESDWSVFPYSIRAINALSLFLPPESICYYHNHIQHAHQTADLDAHLRVTLFALPIFVGFGAQGADRSTVHFQETRRYIGLHRGFCRPVLHQARVFHHTPDIGLFKAAEWCVLEYAAGDCSRGYAGIFRLGSGQGQDRGEYLFRPGGVDPGREYTVALDNRRQQFRISGHELMNTGLRIRLDAALTSELVMYAQDGDALPDPDYSPVGGESVFPQ